MPNNTVAGAPGEIRTPDPQIRSLVLYPAELRARSRLRENHRLPMPPATRVIAIAFTRHWQAPGVGRPAAPAMCTRGTACQPQLLFSAATSPMTALARRKPSAAIGMPA